MVWIFTKKPSSEFKNYSSSHIGAGKEYHNRFRHLPGRALMWELEKVVLQKIIFELRPRTILDFACGTGRIASFIKTKSQDSRIYGIDISESMLKVAKSHGDRINFRLMSSKSAIEFYGEKFFDLIFAFRFFANAEPELRLSTGHDLARLLSDNGRLVINNHRSFWSTSYLGMRLLGNPPVGALNHDIESIFTDHGLQVRQKFSLGVWPQGDSRAFLLPWKVVAQLEQMNLASLASYHTLGYNTIWILGKKQ